MNLLLVKKNPLADISLSSLSFNTFMVINTVLRKMPIGVIRYFKEFDVLCISFLYSLPSYMTEFLYRFS